MSSWVINGEPSVPRACDRCHAIKERCEWPPNSKTCYRCSRLQHICQTVRPTNRPGRKPGSKQPSLRSTSRGTRDEESLRGGQGSESRGSSPAAISLHSLSSTSDMPLSNYPFAQPLLLRADLLELFSISPSFCQAAHERLILHMRSKEVLQDGFLACAISWYGNVDGAANPAQLNTCYRHASSALATLASFKVTDAETMTDCLMLGSLMTTFALRLRVTDLSAICTQTLGLIAPMYTAGGLQVRDSLPFLGCMVMHEISGCLLHSTVPTFRYKPPDGVYIDRYVGICVTLLPLFYDICEFSHYMANGCMDKDMNSLKVLDELEQSVAQWLPEVPTDFTTRYGVTDVAHMLCQAQVLQLTALLVLHRLRHPFGTNDEPARVLSRAIFSQLDMVLRVTKESVRCVDIAFLVACFELKGDERKMRLPQVARYANHSSQFGAHVTSMLETFWTAVDSSKTISWHDLKSLGPRLL